jgi:hypothetical protein
MATGTSMTETIYVALLDEGVEVWRPVQALRRAGDLFQIVSKNDSETETWEFPSGALVRCVEKQLQDGLRIVAVEMVPSPSLKVVE